MVTLEEHTLQLLLTKLQEEGYDVVGPKVDHGAIVYDVLDSAKDLPAGWTEEQSGGTYRLKQRGDTAMFGFTTGPQVWKKFLRPAVTKLWRATKNKDHFDLEKGDKKVPKYAFFGIRPCDLHALTVLDKVLLNGNYTEEGYKARRERLFIVAVNCTEPGGTCFCASMKTGPVATAGYDLVLTEMLDHNRHYFLADAGTAKGAALLESVSHKQTSAQDRERSEKLLAAANKKMGRLVDTNDVGAMLVRNTEHPLWEEVAQRCLNCANCTMVCPTCFCSTIEDVTDLSGAHAERWRVWDSCFTMDFSYIHGGSVRSSSMARYRQWLMHKFSSWQIQFGSPGCVGCGRCITWCPVGIDITEELRRIRESDRTTPISNLAKESLDGNS